MLNSRVLNRMAAIAVPLLGLLIFVTSVRAAALLWQVRDESAVKPVIIAEAEPAQADPEQAVIEDPAVSEAPATAVPGLPGLVKKDAVFFLMVPDYPHLSSAIGSLDFARLWAAGGLNQAGTPLTAEGERLWTAFKKRYAFPVDSIFAGMGAAAGRLEIVISDFTVFRGTYSLRLAAVCHLKNNADEAWARFQQNAARSMSTRKRQDLTLYEKKGPAGILSVFRHADKLYVTAGANACEELITALKGKRPAAVFAENPDLKKQFARQTAGSGSLFVFAAEKLIEELSGKSPGGPASLYMRIDQGWADEEFDLPLTATGYIRPGKFLADIPVPDRCILSLNAAPMLKGIQEIAGLAARMVGWNNPVRITKNNEGCFWDFMYIMGDFCDGNTAGFLKWDENSIILTWYFVSQLRRPADFDAWLKKVSSGVEVGTVSRDDGQKVTIVPCKRQLLDFASFCYIRKGDRLYYSYSSQILKNIPLEGPAAVFEAGEGDALFQADFSELTEFITNRKLTKLLRDFDWFKTSQLTDLPALGRVLGRVHGSFRLNGDRMRLRLRSAAGLSGIPAALYLIETKCNLMKE